MHFVVGTGAASSYSSTVDQGHSLYVEGCAYVSGAGRDCKKDAMVSAGNPVRTTSSCVPTSSINPYAPIFASIRGSAGSKPRLFAFSVR